MISGICFKIVQQKMGVGAGGRESIDKVNVADTDNC